MIVKNDSAYNEELYHLDGAPHIITDTTATRLR